MRTGYRTLRLEDSDSCPSWIWSLSLTLWLFTSSDRLQTPAPYFYPYKPSFPKQEGSWSLLSKRLPHNSTYSLLGLLLYPGTPPFSPIQPGWSFLQGKGCQSAAGTMGQGSLLRCRFRRLLSPCFFNIFQFLFSFNRGEGGGFSLHDLSV